MPGLWDSCPGRARRISVAPCGDSIPPLARALTINQRSRAHHTLAWGDCLCYTLVANEAASLSWSQHIGTLSAAAAFTFVVLKVLVVSRFNPTTALGIVSEGGTAALLAGTMTYAYVLVPIAGLTYVLFILSSARPVRPAIWALALLCVFVASIFGPILVLITLLTGGLCWAMKTLSRSTRMKLSRSSARSRERAGVQTGARPAPGPRDGGPDGHLLRRQRVAKNGSVTDRFVLVGGCVVLLMNLLTAVPWLPPERIVAQGKPGVNGYVVKSSQETTVVLLDKPRELVRYDGKVARTFCRLATQPWFLRSPLALTFDDASYPKCKDIKP